MATPPLFRSPGVLLAIVSLAGTCALHAIDKLSQPVAPVRPVTDTYFGTPVVDPYRWMEDLKSPEVQTWMNGQAAFTKDYLSKLPGRDDLVKRIEALDNAATRVGGVPEAVLDGETGLLVDREDVVVTLSQRRPDPAT